MYFGSPDEACSCCPKHCKLLCKKEMEKVKKEKREGRVKYIEQKGSLPIKGRRTKEEVTRRNSKVTELKAKLEVKQAQVQKEKHKNDEFSSEKAKEMADLMKTLSEAEDATDAKRRTSSQLDEDINSSEAKITELLKLRQSLVSESGKAYKQIEKLAKKKERLERTRDIEMEAYLEEKQSMKQEIEIMNRRIEDLEENDSGCLEDSEAADNTRMIKFLEQIAAAKEKDLECPVRFETVAKLFPKTILSDLPRDCHRSHFQLPGEPRDLRSVSAKVRKKQKFQMFRIFICFTWKSYKTCPK